MKVGLTKAPINTAVIGHGHLGKWHAEKTHSLANLVAIVEVSEKCIQRAKSKYPNVEVVPKLEMIIDKIDAAVVVTPTSSHFNVIKFLLENNKHVFCEKPLVSNLDEANQIRSIWEKRKDIVIQVGHSERFHESWEVIEKYREFIDGPCVIRMNRFAPFKGRALDVDVVSDLMIHDLDLLVYLLNEMPISVKSTGYKIRSQKWDYVCSEFHFKTGKKAYLVASRNHVKEARNMEVFSEAGCLYVDLYENKLLLAPQENTTSGEYIESMEYNKRDHLMVEQQHFFNSILEGKKAIVSLDDGIKAVTLISKVLESLENSKLVEI